MPRRIRPLRSFTFHISEQEYAELERLTKDGLYVSVAEAVRIAVRDLINREAPPPPEGAGAVISEVGGG